MTSEAEPNALPPLKGARAARYLIGNLAILIGLVYFVAWLDRPEIRYHSYPDHYAMIYRQEGPVDLAVAGGSGTVCSFDAKQVGAALEERFGRPFVVYDLSKSWSGSGTKFAMLRDLCEEREVGHLGFRLRLNKTNVHGRFFNTARNSDLFESAFAQSFPWWKQLHQALDLLTDKAAFHLTVSFKGDRRDLASIPVREAASTFANTDAPNGIRPDVIKAWKAQWEAGWDQRPGRSWDFRIPEERRNRHYYRRILALAREEGATASFYEVPRVWWTPLAPEFVAEVEEFYGVPVMQLDLDQMRELYPRGFADTGHTSAFGRRFCSQHLYAEPLAELFAAKPEFAQH